MGARAADRHQHRRTLRAPGLGAISLAGSHVAELHGCRRATKRDRLAALGAGNRCACADSVADLSLPHIGVDAGNADVGITRAVGVVSRLQDARAWESCGVWLWISNA